MDKHSVRTGGGACSIIALPPEPQIDELEYIEWQMAALEKRKKELKNGNS